MASEVIFRRWASRIRTSDEQAYADYIRDTGLRDYAATPGNLGAEMLMKTLGDGSTEVATQSWWDSIESIKKFAGEDYETARYYPEDDQFLLEKPMHVEHYRVVGRSGGKA